MGFQAKTRSNILEVIVSTVPPALWQRLREGAPWAYAEAVDSNKEDARILADHARFKAADDRHYFMEKVLQRAAHECGATFEPKAVSENSWPYGLVKTGKISFTQKAVSSFGEMVAPAKFRERLAETNQYIRQGRFAFAQTATRIGDAEVNGILIHGPESHKFDDEGFRTPAFLCFAVPYPDYSDWAAQFELAELIASYGAQPEPKSKPAPKWKKPKRDEESGGA